MFVTTLISGTEIGNTPKKIDLVRSFAENDKIELNLRKCKEMIIDFRRDGSVIPEIKVNDRILERVSSFNSLKGRYTSVYILYFRDFLGNY